MGNLMMAQSQFRSKILWSVLSLALFLWGWHYAYHHKLLGFSVAKISSDFAYHPEWDVALSTESEQKQLDAIFTQTFHYLGAGSQSYAFVSEDGKIVLKFFRMKHQIFHLKDLWTGNRSQERKDNLESIYASHKLAFEHMKEDAGLIYLHLNKTNHLHRKVKLVDKLHRSFVVDLDRVEFVVQERAELIFDRFTALLQEKKSIDGALGQVMSLVQRRVSRGIADHDKAVTHNFGFVGDRAIQLDVGRVFLEHKPRDYDHVLERIKKWQSRFSLKSVTSTLSPHPQWATSDPAPQAILSQKFTFLGEGAQAIAFQSEDKKYVLKLFKMRRLTPSFMDQLCPHVVRRRLRNLHWVFNGYKNAYEDLRTDTGLVWIHLAKTSTLHQILTVLDQEGREYYLDADATEFVIQEKAELIFDRLSRLRAQERHAEVSQAIASIHALVQRRIEMGYADRDKAISNNYGFVGDRPIQLDLGRLYRGQKPRQLEHVQRRIQEWETTEDETQRKS
jgi:hypothetical protein